MSRVAKGPHPGGTDAGPWPLEPRVPWLRCRRAQEERMAKNADRTSRGRKQDRARVAGGQDYEVRYEANKTGTSKKQVRRAIKTVGVSRKKVERALGSSR